MPIYLYVCESCKTEKKKLLSPEDSKLQQSCLKCKGNLKRTPQAPNTSVKETLDNGIMVRKIERPANAQELYKERSNQNGPGRGML